MHPELRKIQFRNEVSNRKFGFTMAAILMIWGVWLIYKKNDLGWYVVNFALLPALMAAMVPRWLTVPNRMWYMLGILLQSIVSPVLLFIIFCLLIVPVGVVRKIAGKNNINFKPVKVYSNWTEVSKKWNEADFKHLF